MDEINTYMLILFSSMLLVNLIIVFLMFVDAYNRNKQIGFDVKYFIYAFAGALIGFIGFMSLTIYIDILIMKETIPIIATFFIASLMGLGGMGLIEKVAKAGFREGTK